MNYTPTAIRTFIGAKNYQESRAFYQDLEFTEVVLGDTMCLFEVNENLGFYLQDYYVEDWVNNSMVFLEVADLEKCLEDLLRKALPTKYQTVKFTGIKHLDWGKEFLMHDPAGVLWHFCEFRK